MRATPLTPPGSNLPEKVGLYDPADERDACGLASVVSLRSEATHEIVALALEALENLEHRGAVGSDAGTGDGAGILCAIPDAFLRAVLAESDPSVELPEAGKYVTGIGFLPQSTTERRAAKYRIEAIARDEGLKVLTWREFRRAPMCSAALPER